MLVTIGVTFYNNSTTLLEAIRSVFAQTFEDWELILYDDGSTDGSLKIAQAVRDNKVRVIAGTVNRGVAHGRNVIVQEARGEYLAVLDADDMMCPNRIEKQVLFMEENSGVDLVDTSVYSIDENNEPRGKRGLENINGSPLKFLKTGGIVHAALMGRTRWFRENRYDISYRRSADQELFCRNFDKTSFGRIQECLLLYREPYVFIPSSYSVSFQCQRRVILKYGPSLIGVPSTVWLILRSYLKNLAYWTLNKAGTAHLLIERRNVPLSNEEIQSVKAILKHISHTPVPGVDE